MKSVLYLCDDEITSGGAAREHVGAICSAFKSSGYEVTLLCPHMDQGGEMNRTVNVRLYGKGNSIVRAIRMLRAVKSALINVDYDGIYMRYRPSQLVLWMLPGFRKKKRIVELNGVAQAEMKVGLLKRLLILSAQLILESGFMKKSSAIIAVSPGISDFFSKRYRIPPSKITVLSNGVWVDSYEQRLSWPDSPVLKLGFVGHLAWWQGLDTVLSALAPQEMQKRVSLTIVGDGPELSRLKTICEELHLGNVCFTGHIPASRIPLVIARFDIGLVSKSIRTEGFSPLKLYQYWAAGIPVIATELPDLLIVNEISGGLLYGFDNPESFREAVRTAIEQKHQWPEWGANGRAFVESNASWARIGRRTVELFERAAG